MKIHLSFLHGWNGVRTWYTVNVLDWSPQEKSACRCGSTLQLFSITVTMIPRQKHEQSAHSHRSTAIRRLEICRSVCVFPGRARAGPRSLSSSTPERSCSPAAASASHRARKSPIESFFFGRGVEVERGRPRVVHRCRLHRIASPPPTCHVHHTCLDACPCLSPVARFVR
jgi:hypothetical protein